MWRDGAQGLRLHVPSHSRTNHPLSCAFCGEESQYCWCFDLDNAYSKTSHAQVAAFMKEVFPERRRSWSRLHAKTTINKA